MRKITVQKLALDLLGERERDNACHHIKIWPRNSQNIQVFSSGEKTEKEEGCQEQFKSSKASLNSITISSSSSSAFLAITTPFATHHFPQGRLPCRRSEIKAKVRQDSSKAEIMHDQLRLWATPQPNHSRDWHVMFLWSARQFSTCKST